MWSVDPPMPGGRSGVQAVISNGIFVPLLPPPQPNALPSHFL